MPFRAALPTLLVLLALPVSAAADRSVATTTALLPVEGAPQLAAELDRSLGRAVTVRGLSDAIGPLEVAARLRAHPHIKRELAELTEALAKTRKASLFMRRRSAVSAARQAVQAARTALARYHQRQLLAESYEALAQALLLKPADESGALEAFRQSVSADPSYEPPAGRMNPTTTRLLRKAQSTYVPSAPPSARLDALAKLLGVRRVVWLAVEVEGSQRRLHVATHDAGRAGVDQQLRQSLTGADLTKAVADKLVAVLSPKPASVVVIEKKPTSPSSLLTTQPVPQPAATAWYGKWWVWTIVGVVVAGSVTAAVVATRPESNRGYDLKFEF